MEGRVIRSVTIENGDVFNTDDAHEDGMFYRGVNFLHVKSKKQVIRDQLLFKEGDLYSQTLVRESERILRANRYLGEVKIRGDIVGEFVDVVVTTQDTWSTKPKLNFSSSGGETKSEYGFKEENLFGLGWSAELSYLNDVERSTSVYGLKKKHVWGSDYAIALTRESSTDGFLRDYRLENPFVALDDRSAYGLHYIEGVRDEAYYFLGDKYHETNVAYRDHALSYAWSNGRDSGSVLRKKVGWRYDERRYEDAVDPDIYSEDRSRMYALSQPSLAEDSLFSYPYLGYTYQTDRYATLRNHALIGKVEDWPLGWQHGVEIGYASSAFGSTAEAWMVEAYLANSTLLANDTLVTFRSDLSLRWQDGAPRNALSTTSYEYFYPHSEHFKFYSRGELIFAHDLDPYNPLYIGEETGLRAFPVKYLGGERVQKITLEERYYSHARPFRIFGLGAAIFVDIAKISGGSTLDRSASGVYGDVGIGLRIANNRTSHGDMVHIDLAFPIGGDETIDSFQINIKIKPTF